MRRLICLVLIAFAVVSACGGSDDATKASPTGSGGSAPTGSAAATTVPDTGTPAAESTGTPDSAAFQAYRASVTALYDTAAKPLPDAATRAMAGCNDVEGTKDVYHLANDCSTVAQTIIRDLAVTPAVQESLRLQHDFMLSQIDALVASGRTGKQLADTVKAQVGNAPIWQPPLTTPNPAAS